MIRYIFLGFILFYPLIKVPKDDIIKEPDIKVDITKIELLAEAIYNECGNCNREQQQNVGGFIIEQAYLYDRTIQEELEYEFKSYKYSYQYKVKSLNKLTFEQRDYFYNMAFELLYTDLRSDVSDRISSYGFTNYISTEMFNSRKKPRWAKIKNIDYMYNDGKHVFIKIKE